MTRQDPCFRRIPPGALWETSCGKESLKAGTYELSKSGMVAVNQGVLHGTDMRDSFKEQITVTGKNVNTFQFSAVLQITKRNQSYGFQALSSM